MQEHIYSLIIKEQTEYLSEEEVKALDGWLQEEVEHQKVYKQVITLLDDCNLVVLYESIDVDKAWGKVEAAISINNTRIVKPIIWRRWISYVAAAAMLLLSVSIWQYSKQRKEDNIIESTLTDVAPGSNRAYLTTESGQQVSLNDTQSILIIGDEIKYPDGSQVQGVSVNNSIVQNLQLVVPRGGTYQVILADGTKVWLNSDSKLIYPSRFEGSERIVELEGEGYFEVSKAFRIDKGKKLRQPFIVQTSKQRVEVLGTEFNISDYPESATKTTLMEGRVEITVDKQKKILQPGQQATTIHKEIGVHMTNVSQVQAWKEGYFDFTDVKFEEVMTQLARWYDINVTYEGQIPKITFYGAIERDNKLSTVLTLLETNNLGYKLNNKQLTIYHNSDKEGKPKK
ncbi:MAG: DUF4974 domain-containing protein [Sphingobacterium sp.]|jgi:ferric-dicitrate binding protein FerR (iron transport regulator)|nr:DUF4974 domain-containing protein [Sphingobacterium sp.]